MAFQMHKAQVERQRAWVAEKLRQREETLMNFLKRLWQEEEGQDLVEYALLLVLVALAATVGMKNLANAINSTFGTAATNLTTNT
jgi:pilus assembly protein Flp/PilA